MYAIQVPAKAREQNSICILVALVLGCLFPAEFGSISLKLDGVTGCTHEWFPLLGSSLGCLPEKHFLFLLEGIRVAYPITPCLSEI